MNKILLFLSLIPFFAFSQYVGLQFDGGGDYIQTDYNGVAGSGSRTVQFWYRGTSSPNQMFLVDMGYVGGGNGARFSVKINSSTNVPRIEIGGGGLSGTAIIANNFWHHVTVVYDNTAATNKYKIYVDGAFNVEGDIAVALNTPATSANPLTIGIRTDLDLTTDLFGGMDDVRIWTVALSAAQISANYNKELCGTPAGLAAYYKMDEGISTSNNTAITSLYDEVTPSSVNTLYGFALTGNSSNYTTHILNVVNNTASQTLTSCGNYVWTQTGLTYNATGTYTDTVNLSPGCDSVYTLNLTVNPIPPTTVSVATCTDYFWPQTGQTYSATGMYNDTLPSAAGCDSIIILDLTITPISPTVTNTSACSSYLWPQNGLTYTTSGTYNDTVLTSAGCDSIISLNLTINSPSSSTVVVNACDDYVWTQNSIAYTSSGTYSDTVTNAAGCDSIVELVLTINTSSLTTEAVSACSSFVWPFNNQTYTSSGVYSDTLPNSAGCDSIVQLTLTIFSELNTITNSGNGILVANVSGATYQWLNCADNSEIPGATNQGYSPTVNGSYSVITTTTSCADTSACEQIMNVGLDELKVAGFKLYPNPTPDNFTIESGENQVVKTLVIRDVQGKLINLIEVNKSNHVVDMKHLEAGVYYITVQNDQQTFTYRLVKN